MVTIRKVYLTLEEIEAQISKFQTLLEKYEAEKRIYQEKVDERQTRQNQQNALQDPLEKFREQVKKSTGRIDSCKAEIDFFKDLYQQINWQEVEKLLRQPYFFLYDALNQPNIPAACYFTKEGLLVPTDTNALYRWFQENRPPSAPPDIAVSFWSRIDQLIRSDGRAHDPEVQFLTNFRCFLWDHNGEQLEFCMPFSLPEGEGHAKTLPTLPTWCLILTNENDLAALYRKVNLIPKNEIDCNWIEKLVLPSSGEQPLKCLTDYFRWVESLRLGREVGDLPQSLIDTGECWDIFEKGQADKNKFCFNFPNDLWLKAKPPFESVKSGSVSVDFGTKSTVAVIPDGNFFQIFQFPAGFTSPVALYPTALKFRNLEGFLKNYEQETARPMTEWDMVSVYGESNREEEGVFRHLKQWMMDPRAGGAILRQEGAPQTPIELEQYGSDKNRVDPIELYTYYLGLQINNNRDNQIFLRYQLSYSATCPDSVRALMEESFRRGLTKSLPGSVIKETERPDTKFPLEVKCICSEPTAYAVCALSLMGIPSQLAIPVFYYGIFDFGGGTCDFSYGAWVKDPQLPSYELHLLGDGGDPLLGGENILELLAVEVCRKTEKVFGNGKYRISRPRCYEGQGRDFFANTSTASMNLEILVGELREKLWEMTEQATQDNITLDIGRLLPEEQGMDDKFNPGNSTQVSLGNLKGFLQNRINQGVADFFQTFYRLIWEQGRREPFPHLCVFLAGNSSRSPLVRESFEKYIQNRQLYQKWIKEIVICDPIGAKDFQQHLPKGYWDDGQVWRMSQRMEKLPELDGKTGVAYGLALYGGNHVKVVDYRSTDRLLYYLGIRTGLDIEEISSSDGGRLKLEESVQFCKTPVVSLDLYYTTCVPQGGILRNPIEIHLTEEMFPNAGDAAYYVRADTPTEISIFQVPGNGLKNGPNNYNHLQGQVFDLRTKKFK